MQAVKGAVKRHMNIAESSEGGGQPKVLTANFTFNTEEAATEFQSVVERHAPK